MDNTQHSNNEPSSVGVQRLREKHGIFIQEAINNRREVQPPDQQTETHRNKHKGVKKWYRDYVELSTDEIFCEEQPRTTFDEEYIGQLADSILDIGQKAPVLVNYDEARGKWRLVLGECRYRACLKAGLKTIKCELREGQATEADVLKEQIAENLHRRNLQPMEEAKAFQRLKELAGLGVTELAQHLHVSKSKVSKALALLKLPDEVQAKVQAGEVKPSSAYQISQVQNEDQQRHLATKVREKKLTHNDTLNQVRKVKGKEGIKKKVTDKNRSANGVVTEATWRKKHTIPDIVAALREHADKLEQEQAKTKNAA
jgi:ParB family chromosome partitioning protein